MDGHQDWIITSDELKNCLGSVKLLDVREPEEVAVSFIDGAHFIPLGEISLRAPHELNSEETIVVYCAHGVRSLHAVAALRKMGFDKTRSLTGGIVAWESENVVCRSTH